MTNLITEARELIEDLHDGRWEYERIDYCAYEKLVALCDALEKAEEQNKQLMREVSQLACESVERDRALAKLEAEVEHAITATRWIPVAERLPDYDVPVLVTYLGFTDNKPYSDGIARWVLEMNGYTGGWEWTPDGGEVEVTITHWMPLPEPPKGE